MKLETMLDNPLEKFKIKKNSVIKIKDILYCQCPICGIVCKTKKVFKKHMTKHILKNI